MGGSVFSSTEPDTSDSSCRSDCSPFFFSQPDCVEMIIPNTKVAIKTVCLVFIFHQLSLYSKFPQASAVIAVFATTLLLYIFIHGWSPAFGKFIGLGFGAFCGDGTLPVAIEASLIKNLLRSCISTSIWSWQVPAIVVYVRLWSWCCDVVLNWLLLRWLHNDRRGRLCPWGHHVRPKSGTAKPKPYCGQRISF